MEKSKSTPTPASKPTAPTTVVPTKASVKNSADLPKAQVPKTKA